MKRQWFLICLFSLLLVSCVFGAYRYYDPYYGGAGFGSGLGGLFDSFLDLVEENEFLIDAIVFLVIFLIISKKVFENYSENKALYIVIGIALTIGVMMYERRTGYSFIVNVGGLSFLVILGFIAYIISRSKLVGLKMISLSLIGLIALFYLPNKIPEVWTYLPPAISSLLVLICIVVLIIGIVKLFKEKDPLEGLGLGIS